MKDIERKQVTLHGFLLGVKFENHDTEASGDNDFHCEVADTSDWDSDPMVVEVPPYQDYCVPRRTVWKLVQADSQASGKPVKDIYGFDKPAHVDVTGYVLLDGTHAPGGPGAAPRPRARIPVEVSTGRMARSRCAACGRCLAR